MKKNVLFILHRLYFDNKTKEGGVDFFVRFFRYKKYNLRIIEHPLEDTKCPSKLIVNDKIKKEYLITQKPPLRWLKELSLSKKIIKEQGIKYQYAYASDPLNFLVLYWAKKQGFTEKIFFHCTDFSKTRFKNPLFNFVYQQIFKFSLKHADMTNVVTRYVLDMARDIAPNAKINLIPNSPIFDSMPKIEPGKKNKNTLAITISCMTKRSNFQKYLEIIKLVKCEIPDIKFTIVGSADDYVKDLIKREKMEKNIIITGLLPYNEAIKKVAESYLGIVFYPTGINHVKYGDSIKIREYAASGLVTVSDNITLTSQEVLKEGAGLTADTPEDMAKNICQLIKDEKLYLKTRDNALVWAKKMDKQKILDKIFA